MEDFFFAEVDRRTRFHGNIWCMAPGTCLIDSRGMVPRLPARVSNQRHC